MEKAVRRLAVVATIGMFLVLIMGSTVTNTGSAEGCGRSWPLCHGEFIPAYAFETAVEYSHRLVTSIEGVLIAVVALGALRLRRGNREVKVLVALMVGTLLLQSGLGASAVMWPQQPAVKATHFGVSLICFASVFLLTRLLYQTGPQSRSASRLPSASSAALPLWYRRATWATLAFVIGVAYLGAYMRHSGAEMACATWPSCNGQWFPGFDGATGVAFGHRLAAFVSAVLVASLAYVACRSREAAPDLFRVTAAGFVLILAQALAGAAVVLSRLDLWTTLAHAGLMALLFVCLADACRQVLPASRAAAPSRTPLTTAPLTTR
jgi:cytochrome c oxidase assembly protein subunit 15